MKAQSMAPPSALRQFYPSEAWIILGLMAVTAYVYYHGIMLPCMTLSKMFFMRNTVSVWGSIQSLYAEKEWLLFILITLFTLVTPLLKMLSILQQWFVPAGRRSALWFRVLHFIGKWAMLDVFVIALLLVSVKLGALANLTIHSGVYWFVAAILLLWCLSGVTYYYHKCRYPC